MKICPLVTHALILEEEEQNLLLREADSRDLDDESPKDEAGEIGCR